MTIIHFFFCVLSLTAHVHSYFSSDKHRLLVSDPYFSTDNPSILGAPNALAAMGNPLKGLYGGARWEPPPLPEAVPLSIEWYNIGLEEIMIGDDEYDWSPIDNILVASASRKKHVAFSVYIDWPGRPLRMPLHLLGADGVMLIEYAPDRISPDYGDPILLEALEKYIKALGSRYDGDKRIFVIHLGLLGFWGEFHTHGYDNLLPESSKRLVVDWYKSSFRTTQLSVRYPIMPQTRGIGLNDGSFAYKTLDGHYNGNVNMSWYFWPQVMAANEHNFWKNSTMTGETRPELQNSIFTNQYPGGTFQHQRFSDCVQVTHASAILHHDAFVNGGYTGTTLENALSMHASMGYNFYVSKISLAESSRTTVDIAVTVRQIGVAPFYYDLGLALSCIGLSQLSTGPGLESLMDYGDEMSWVFTDVPATRECLSALEISLVSSYAYPDRPVRFAQGLDGILILNLPLPSDSLTSFLAMYYSSDARGIYPYSTLLNWILTSLSWLMGLIANF